MRLEKCCYFYDEYRKKFKRCYRSNIISYYEHEIISRYCRIAIAILRVVILRKKEKPKFSEIDDVAASHKLLRLRQREKRDRDKPRLRRIFCLIFLGFAERTAYMFRACVAFIFYLI